MPVNTTHGKYDELLELWTRCRDTSEGSEAVKKKGAKYLPPLDSHKTEGKRDKFREYVQRALFYNAMGRTVHGLAGAIFQKAPAVICDQANAKEDIKDITLTGEPLDMFALKVTKEHLITGRYGILVDMSTEEATTPRPYWVGYPAEDIINWRFERMGGDQELCLVVLREVVDNPEGEDEFSVDQVTQYRVLRLVGGVYSQQLYREIKKSDGSNGKEIVADEVVIPTRRSKPLDFIPFALPWTVMTPPLLDLADVNLAHYRGNADLKHGLHFTALPTPWVSGQIGDTSKPLAIGSGTAWSLEKDGKAGMLEFTGQGLGAIREDLQDMQRMMATLGARLLEEAPRYAETALSVSMRHSSDYATLRTLAQIVEQQITFALQIHCWWLGTATLVADVKAGVELNKVFFDHAISADELHALLAALQSKTISYKTFYARLNTTGWTREGIDAETEIADILAQSDKIGIKPESAVPPPDPKEASAEDDTEDKKEEEAKAKPPTKAKKSSDEDEE